jgi:hypothetical protein
MRPHILPIILAALVISFFIVLSFVDGLLFSTPTIAQTTLCGAVWLAAFCWHRDERPKRAAP